MDTISVIIPVYNRAGWIATTLEHIFAQELPIYEVVLCDDGSTDDIAGALQPYAEKIKIIRIENSGPGNARKVAIDNSKGDWIALCDSDDYWLPGHITQFDCARQNFPEMDFYFSDFITSDQQATTKLEAAPEGWLASISSNSSTKQEFINCSDNLYSALLRFQPCFQSACIIKRELYEQIGGIDPRISRFRSEDAHLTRRLAAYGKAVIGLKPTVIINKHLGNFSSDLIRNMEGRLNILQRLVDNIEIPVQFMEQTKIEIQHSHRDLFRLYYWNGLYRDMISQWGRVPLTERSLTDYLRFIKGYFFDKIRSHN